MLAACVIRFGSAAGLQKSEIATSGTPGFQRQIIDSFKNSAAGMPTDFASQRAASWSEGRFSHGIVYFLFGHIEELRLHQAG
jgi:hypothetical protein